MLLDLAVSGGLVAGWQTNTTSFSIALTAGRQRLWEYHHTAGGGGSVTGDTQFRVASVSKVFTDLLLLKLGLPLDEPVTTYLPELLAGSAIAWSEVTLGALGDHMAGIPGACRSYNCRCYVVELTGWQTGLQMIILSLGIFRISGFRRFLSVSIRRAA